MLLGQGSGLPVASFEEQLIHQLGRKAGLIAANDLLPKGQRMDPGRKRKSFAVANVICARTRRSRYLERVVLL